MLRLSQSVLVNTAFRKYFIGTTISSIGNGMQFIGIAWFLYKLTGSSSSMGWLLATSSLSGILFSPWIGVLIDKWDRRVVCIIADCFRGTIVLIIPILYYLDVLLIWQVYLIVFLMSIGDRFYLPASGGLVREIVPKTNLLSANSLSSMFNQLGLLIGTSISGIIMMHFSPVFVMLLNAVSFYVSAFFTFLVRNNIVLPNNDSKKSSNFFSRFLEGVQYLKYNKLVLCIAVIQSILYIALYTSNVLLPSFTGEILKLGAKEFGIIDSAWAAGAIVGGFLLLKITSKIDEHKFLSIGMFCLAGSIIIFSNSNGLIQAVIGYFLMGLFFVSTRINSDTLIQSNVKTNFQGRVKSTISMAISYISFTSYLLVGYLGDMINIRFIYLALSIIIILGGTFSIISIYLLKTRGAR